MDQSDAKNLEFEVVSGSEIVTSVTPAINHLKAVVLNTIRLLENNPLIINVSREWRDAFLICINGGIRGFTICGGNYGFVDRFDTMERFLELETQHLDLREHQEACLDEVVGISKQKGPISQFDLRQLTLKIALFLNVRQELLSQGFTLPETPALQTAVDILKRELGKNPRLCSAWEQLSGEQSVRPNFLGTRAIAE